MSQNIKINVNFADICAEELFAVAKRKNNPKREFLFVSKVLGKHLEVCPQKMQKIYDLLSQKLSKFDIEFPALFIGLAETATCLATGVFSSFLDYIKTAKKENLNSIFYLQSSRYKVQNCNIINFAEQHSHSPQQYLNISENFYKTNILQNAKTLVLIDDEISTGNTFYNLILALQNAGFLSNLQTIILVSITNFSDNLTNNFYEKLNKFNNKNLNIKTCEILQGNYVLQEKSADDLNSQKAKKFAIVKKDFSKNIILSDNYFGRCGFVNADLNNEQNYFKKNLQNLVENCCYEIQNHLKNNNNENENDYKILVLGSGEFMFFPYKFALKLQQEVNEKFAKKNVCENHKNLQNNDIIKVLFKATTRSPIDTIKNDVIDNKISFLDNYGEGIDNYLYNLKNHSYKQIILCVETPKNFAEKYIKNIIRKLKNCQNCLIKVIYFCGENYEICDFF